MIRGAYIMHHIMNWTELNVGMGIMQGFSNLTVEGLIAWILQVRNLVQSQLYCRFLLNSDYDRILIVFPYFDPFFMTSSDRKYEKQ